MVYFQRIIMTAFIIKGGNIFAIGNNKYIRLSYTFKKENGYSEMAGLHAELDAINQTKKHILKGSTIIIHGVTKAGNIVKSFPCKACMNAIKAVGIKKIVWMDKQGNKHIERVK